MRRSTQADGEERTSTSSTEVHRGRLESGELRIDLAAETVERAGRRLELPPKSLALLLLLVERRGALVARDAVEARLWPHVVVEPNNLRVQLAKLRRALGDRADAPRYVETVRGRGYRWVAPIAEDASGGTPAQASTLTERNPRSSGRTGPLSKRTVLAAAVAAGLLIAGLAARLGELPAERTRSPAAAPGPSGAASSSAEVPVARDSAPYRLYLDGRHAFAASRSREGIARAIDLYRRALAGEPRLALAQAGLAEAYLQEAIFHFGALDPRRAFDLAGQASRAALALDPSLASAHATLGHVAFLAERDFERAERHYRRAVEQSPPRAQAHQRYAWFLLTLGHRAAARRQIDLALDAEPLDVNANAAFGLFLHLVGENAAARTHLEATHRRHPDSALPLLPLARLAESEGRYRESLRWYRVAEKILGAETETRAGVAYASARLGRIADARAVLAELEARAASGEYVAQYHLAAVRLGLGERRAALDGLLRASEDRSLWLPWLRFDHRLAPLENEGAFRELLCSIGVDRPGSSSAPVAVADQGVGAAFFTASSTPSSKVRKLSTNIRASSRACAS